MLNFVRNCQTEDLVDTSLFRSSVSVCISFGRCSFQGTGSFHVGYQMCGHKVIHNIILSFF